MKRSYLFLFTILILAPAITCSCAAAALEGSSGNITNPDLWIHLDPVSDQGINDSFVITGTTNLPAGEIVDIDIYSTRLDHRKNPPPKWAREYSITIQNGNGKNNTFSTPVIWLTPSKIVRGSLEKIWPGDEYLVVAEYQGNTSVESSTFFVIDNAGVSPTSIPSGNTSDSGERMNETPATPPQKSSVSLVLAIVALGIIGGYSRGLKKP